MERSEEDVSEDTPMDARSAPPVSTTGPQHAGEWGTQAPGHHYAQGETHSHMGGNIVQIIVPEMSCMQANGNHLSMHATSGAEMVMTCPPQTSMAMMSNRACNITHSSLAPKDSLSALAAAAEMDQIRHSEVLGESVLEGMKFDHSRAANHQLHKERASQQMEISEVINEAGDTSEGGSHSHNTHSIYANSFSGIESKLPSEFVRQVLPLAPFLHPKDHDVVFYNEIYHFICSGSFPESSSEVYKKIVKKRASNYILNENGTLSYGKSNRHVITNPSEQKRLLHSSHVDKTTGVHYGVRKMYNMVFGKYYWRTLYVDIGNFVRRCQTCVDVTTPSKEGGNAPLGELDLNTGFSTLPVDRIMRVWKKVVVQIHGPYGKSIYGNEYIMSIVDPFSKWLLAKASPKFDLLNQCAKFVFDSFCNFGFAQCMVVGMNHERFAEMQSVYREKFDDALDILRSIVPPLESENAHELLHFSLLEECHECSWAGELFEDLCTRNPNCWDDELSRLLFRHSTTLSSEVGLSPFSFMFARNPTGYISEQEKENISILEQEKTLEVTTNRRKLRSSTLQCRHCEENFTSKISFRIHQRKHTEDARRRGTLDGEEPLTCPLVIERRPLVRITRKKKPFSKGPRRLVAMPNSEWSNKHSKDDIPLGIRQQVTQSTVEAVKNLLNATKEERSKRGKYHKYSSQLRDEIAQYAIDHCIPAASVYWTKELGTPVSESSIRNFIRNYKRFSPSSREEIGRFAYNNGVDKALAHFRDKLNLDLHKGIVVKLKKIYGRKFCGNNSQANFGHGESKRVLHRKRMFSQDLKQDIGRHAYHHGVPSAIEHFSVRLQFDVKEGTVRKFKNMYAESLSNNPNEVANADNLAVQTSLVANQPSTEQPQMDVLQSPISVLSSPTVSGSGLNVTSQNNFVYQHPYSLNMTTSGLQANTAVIPMNHNSLTFHQGSVINQGLATQTYQPTPAGQAGPPTVLMNQAFSQVAPPPFHQGYVGGFAQASANGVAGPGAPLALAHTTVSPSSAMAHSNSPLQLTMGGAHLSQLSSVSVAPVHHLNASPNIQASPSSTHPNHVAHAPLQLVASTFAQSISGSLAFESGGPGSLVNATVNLSNEPLSLLKEDNVESSMPHTEENEPGGLQDSSVNVPVTVNGVATSIIQIPNDGMPHMQDVTHPQPHQDHQQQHHTHVQHHYAHPTQQHLSDTQQPSHESILIKKQEDVYIDQENDLENDIDDYSDPPTPKKRKGKVKYQSSYACSKRGNYVSYSPQLRAEIAQYAFENGNLATISHFKDKLGIDIPESTVRGLKDKYLLKMMRGEKDIKSLGFAQRGRPMRLGKYDNIVQECIKELMNSGEKISSFLVIATAKQVLMQYEPSLLEENGGDIKLNTTWAKSFLKRIGLQKA